MVVMEDAVEHKWHRRKTKALQIIFLKPVHRIKANPDYLEDRQVICFPRAAEAYRKYKYKNDYINHIMVKVVNKYGDIKAGKQGNTVYQMNNGVHVRRIKEHTHKNDKVKQILVQSKFREGIDFANSLTPVEIETIQSYLNILKVPMTWHNYARSISMQAPALENPEDNLVIVRHPGIKEIECYSPDGLLLETFANMTDLAGGRVVTRQAIKIDDKTYLRIIAADNKVYTLHMPITEFTLDTSYLDIGILE